MYYYDSFKPATTTKYSDPYPLKRIMITPTLKKTTFNSKLSYHYILTTHIYRKLIIFSIVIYI